MSREAKILTAILTAVVVGMIGLFTFANRDNTADAPKGDKTKIVRDSSHKEGTGAIQLVEFGDYQCPACGAAYPNVKQLMKDFDGKITFYFRNFPLPNVHQNAMASANAAEAAADQGKFWEMHDKLYETQKEWSDQSDPTAKFVAYAKDLGLDADKFKKAIADKQFQSVIDQDIADTTALNLQGTPTFFFNGTQYTGDSSYASLSGKINELLKASGTATNDTATPSASPAPSTTPTP